MSDRQETRAFTATVVVVGAEERLVDAGQALEELGETGVRAILISEGDQVSPEARVAADVVEISGLSPRYLNNAVASLRLSSLPTLVWWRGGSAEALSPLTSLADRVVLDVESPDEEWRLAPGYFEHTALTDLRWARLTRWRSALAHLFDLPQVAESASKFQRLSIDAIDPYAGRLFAGWLQSRLGWSGVAIEIAESREAEEDAAPPLTRVQLEAANLSISLDLRPGHGCLAATVEGLHASTRIVPLGDGSLASLIAEELGVRSRDLAFEQALTAAKEIRG
jgi:glucose-6-phosphate dehydrogenase assembly protein OpcA